MSEYIVCSDKVDIALYSSLKQVCKDYDLKYSTVQKRMNGRDKEYFLKTEKDRDTILVEIHRVEKIKIKGIEKNWQKRVIPNVPREERSRQ